MLSAMKHFWNDFWPYIVLPIALVVIGIMVLALIGDEPASPFVY